MTLIIRSINEPVRRDPLPWEQVWQAGDRGLIACWERGRVRSLLDPKLSEQAKLGELVVLPYKGGIAKGVKKPRRYAPLEYLAMWQGLRQEDLYINLIQDHLIKCTATGLVVTFTSVISRYSKEV